MRKGVLSVKILKEFFKNETVLSIALICAVISMIFVPPNLNYLGYINTSVLIMLFCLMIVVSGLNSIEVFNTISKKLLDKVSNTKMISIILVNLCLILSMFITNDVALITIVPLTLSILKSCDIKTIIKTITMETISANLGSMITPIGNPQNIFIYENYRLSIGEFFKIMLPLGLISLVIINIVLIFSKSENIKVSKSTKNIVDKKRLILYLIMFGICVLTILKIINHITCLLLIFILTLLINPKLFMKVDYSLLLTFICFFIFVGNIGNINVIREFISRILTGKEVLVSVILSQIISNVPATLMLSNFTDNYKSLLIGVNLGGLGILIGSLASLISFKFFSKEYKSSGTQYIKTFSIYNFSILAILMLIYYTILK